MFSPTPGPSSVIQTTTLTFADVVLVSNVYVDFLIWFPSPNLRSCLYLLVYIYQISSMV